MKNLILEKTDQVRWDTNMRGVFGAGDVYLTFELWKYERSY